MNVYEKLEKAVFIATNKNSRTNGVLVQSSKPGMGKSSSTKEIFVKNNIPFKQYSGKISPLAAYSFFQENADSVILWDDVCGDDSPAVLGLAKILLGRDKDNNPLPCSYRNNNRNETFYFSGSLILLTNGYMTDNDIHLMAVLDRMIKIDFNLSYTEIIKKMENIVNDENNFKDIPQDTKYKVMDVIKKISSPSSENFSLRVLTQALDAAITLKEDWQVYVKELLTSKQIYFDTLIELSHSNISVFEQVKRYKELTGRSERSYFSDKKRAKDYGII